MTDAMSEIVEALAARGRKAELHGHQAVIGTAVRQVLTPVRGGRMEVETTGADGKPRLRYFAAGDTVGVAGFVSESQVGGP